MHDKHRNPWHTLSTRIVYDNPWIRVREDQVIHPDQRAGIYGVVHYKNIAIGILPIDLNGAVHLVGQYRYPLERYSWEIPEGGCPEDEEPLNAAQRELLEETGLQAREWKLLGEAHLSNSVSDERALWYLATDLIEGKAEPEGSEVLARKAVRLEDALAMIDRREITDALSIMALYHYARLLNCSRKRESTRRE
jgi:8-oxo-dGTP pyrophosphatase MutT (NUDIX family)